MLPPPNFLLSYAFFDAAPLTVWRDKFVGGDPRPLFIADSGAFTAKQQKATIDLDQYVEWINQSPGLTWYANLDAIGDPTRTAINQRMMENRGVHPVPVFHVGSDLRVLSKLCDRHDRVAIGGMVPYASRKRQLAGWLVKVHRIAQDTDTALHAFGMTNLELFLDFPWESGDSSSWGAAHRYGRIILWDGRKLVGFHRSDRAAWIRHRLLIAEHGFNPQEVINAALFDRDYLVTSSLSGVAWLRFCEAALRYGKTLYIADLNQGAIRALWSTWQTAATVPSPGS